MRDLKEEIKKAIESFGYKNFTLKIHNFYYNRYLVFVNGERFGIYDADRRTFID